MASATTTTPARGSTAGIQIRTSFKLKDGDFARYDFQLKGAARTYPAVLAILNGAAAPTRPRHGAPRRR